MQKEKFGAASLEGTSAFLFTRMTL